MTPKKADISVTLLVFLALFVSAAALLSFIVNNNKISTKIVSSMFLENLYNKEERIKFYIGDFGERALMKSYREMIDEGLFAGQNPEREQGVIVFNKFDSKQADETLKEKFVKNFKEEVLKYSSDDSALLELQKQAAEQKFSVSIGDGVLSLKLQGADITGNLVLKGSKLVWDEKIVPSSAEESGEMDIIVRYSPEIQFKLDFKEAGVHDFKDIYSYSAECKNKENSESCIKEVLVNFDAQVVEKEPYKLIKLSGKRKFLIEQKLEKISVEFLM